MSGDEDLMAAMGFTSFGQRPRVKCTESQRSEIQAQHLPQLMPGTELVGKCTDFSVDRISIGPHGVVSLLCREIDSDDKNALEAALDEDMSEETEEGATHEHEVSYSTVLKELDREKCKFDELERSQFLSARTATNAYETLGRHQFLNRSAMKLVTLDYIFQWTRDLEQRQKALSFTDICGGPGGFSEYLLWRSNSSVHQDVKTGQRVYGYGMTLKEAANNCDWRLPSKFRDFFEICYGEDGTGDLYSLANISCFRDVVRARHRGGVDLVVADGGFQHARSKLNQESILTRLVLAEILTMFAVLRVGGDFVCKTFELTTPAMLQLCWLLHRCFGRFTIVKPITSRPASSERYIVARDLRASRSIPKLVKILEDQLVQSSSNDTQKPHQFDFLPNRTPMYEDLSFHKYMTAANEAIAKSQVQACRRINEFSSNKNKRKSCETDAIIDPTQYYQCWRLSTIPRCKFAQ